MKRKKFWLVLASVICFLFVACGGTLIVTGLKTVSVEYTSTLSPEKTKLNSNTLSKVKESGKFSYGTSLLFMNFSDNISKIEKSNPYIKVEKIVRNFPNKVDIYVSERIAKYRIKDSINNSQWYILDSEFKVLATTCEADEYVSSTIFINYLAENLDVGDFYNNSEKSNLNNIMSGAYAVCEDYLVIKSLDYVNDVFTIVMRGANDSDDCFIKIFGNENLKEKTIKGIRTFYYGEDGNQSHPNFSNKIITISNDLTVSVSNK